MLSHIQAIILAAGKSTRFNTNKTKLLEPICGNPMIMYPITVLSSLQIPITMVVGYQKEQLITTIQNITNIPINFVEQKLQSGTGSAIMCSSAYWEQQDILIMNGDMPLVTEELIQNLIQKHQQTNAALSFIVSHDNENTTSAYGKVIQTESSIEIVEARNFTGDPSAACCINAGIYLVSKSFLEHYLPTVQRDSVSHEWYFTDLIKIASDTGHTVTTLAAPFDTIRGVNTLQELWATEQIKRAELIKHWMNNGVRFAMPQTVHIDAAVTLGSGSFIDAGVHLKGTTSVGTNSSIHAFSVLRNVSLGNNVTIYSHCVLSDTQIHDNAQVGPFAHVSEQSTLFPHSAIGNFVEVKRSTIGEHSKAKHLSYLGDALIGQHVNIGAGTITCNYDGTHKHATTIEDNVFIGSNNTLVAPLTIHHHAFTAAGSTITQSVPPYTLAFGRARQVNKEGYVHPTMTTEESPSPTSTHDDDPDINTKSFIGAIKTDVDPHHYFLD